MNEVPLAIAICTIVSILWYYISKHTASKFYSSEDMTIPIFLAGMAAFTFICVMLLIVMIVWWY